MHIAPLNETFSCLFLWFKIINTSATEMMFLHRIEPCVAVRSMTDNSTFFTLIAVNGSKDLTTSITVIILALLNLQIINFFKIWGVIVCKSIIIIRFRFRFWFWINNWINIVITFNLLINFFYDKIIFVVFLLAKIKVAICFILAFIRVLMFKHTSKIIIWTHFPIVFILDMFIQVLCFFLTDF